MTNSNHPERDNSFRGFLPVDHLDIPIQEHVDPGWKMPTSKEKLLRVTVCSTNGLQPFSSFRFQAEMDRRIRQVHLTPENLLLEFESVVESSQRIAWMLLTERVLTGTRIAFLGELTNDGDNHFRPNLSDIVESFAVVAIELKKQRRTPPIIHIVPTSEMGVDELKDLLQTGKNPFRILYEKRYSNQQNSA